MRAFAPGSVTAIFAPAGSGDESMGASFAVEDGVIADVEPADEPAITVEGDPTDFEPVELALADLSVSARVDLTPEVPIGCGFGASGAATLATALAANQAFGLGKTREELVSTSHRAEVAAGTGLGDVFIQDLGGLVVGDGTTRRRFERDAPIEYVSYGGIPTAEMLADEELMATIERAGTAALDALTDDPSLVALTQEAWKFAEETGLPTAEIRDAVGRVEDAGGVASMAMVGETAFAVGVEDALPNRTRICPTGAELR